MAEEKVILAATRYNFVPDGGTEALRGTKAQMLGVALPETPNSKGVNVLTVSGSYDIYGHLITLPGYYNCEIVLKMSGGKAIATLTSAKFIRPYGQQQSGN